VKKLLSMMIIINLAGCATINDYCEVHSKGCVLTGEVVGVVAVTAITIAVTHSGPKTVQNCNPADAGCSK